MNGTGPGRPRPPSIGGAATMCAALSQEAAELAALMRVLQDDFTAVRPGMLPDEVVMSVQALDRVCQTLDDFGAIFESLAASVASCAPGPRVVGSAIGAARQDHLRRRLASGHAPTPAPGGDEAVELF